MNISQSKINLFISCSKKYYYKYIAEDIPKNVTKIDNLIIGSFVHKSIEMYLEDKFDLDHKIFIEFLRPEYFKDSEEGLSKVLNETYSEDAMIKACKDEMIEEYFDQIFEDKQEELKTKKNIYFGSYTTAKRLAKLVTTKINEILDDFNDLEVEKVNEIDKIYTRADLIAHDKMFNKIIIDFKISKKDIIRKKDVQSLLYAYVYKKQYNILPKFCYINIIYSNKNEVEIKEIKKIMLDITISDLDIAEEYIEMFKKGIENEVFFRNTNSFLCNRDFCEYFDFCQEYQFNDISNNNINEED